MNMRTHRIVSTTILLSQINNITISSEQRISLQSSMAVRLLHTPLVAVGATPVARL